MLHKTKEIFAFVKEDDKSIDVENRRVRFVISSDKLDRDNERIEVSAIAEAIPAFSKNPTALACHLHRLSDGHSPVIGSWDTASFKALAHTSEMDLVFAQTKLGEEYWTLYSNKHMRAVSIGFRVLDGHEEVKNGQHSYVITKIELYEISCVPVGANREALAKVKEIIGSDIKFHQGETLDAKAIDALCERLEKQINEKFDVLEASLEDVKDIITASDVFADHLEQLGKGPTQLDPAGDTDQDGPDNPERLSSIERKALTLAARR